MAWTSINRIYTKKCKSDTISYLKARLEYMINDEKTNNQKYVSSYECEPNTAHILFEQDRQNYLNKVIHKDDGEKDVVAYDNGIIMRIG